VLQTVYQMRLNYLTPHCTLTGKTVEIVMFRDAVTIAAGLSAAKQAAKSAD
jgi:hypothetical protein